jgi:hypothetical protein
LKVEEWESIESVGDGCDAKEEQEEKSVVSLGENTDK